MRHAPDLNRLRRRLPFRLLKEGWWLPFDPAARTFDRSAESLELIP
ncbi:MAG: hypothetical protein KDJ73_03060 [Notoacmeibacter sp.]|nr:hypothetical protein [Notoacmeibacter sp.]MCC0033320.1 hypothetical protein [Brucellaceae bacterium]